MGAKLVVWSLRC